jgi:hypothetical protein
MAITSTDGYIQYGWEASYGSETGTYDKGFGLEQNFSSTLSNNMLSVGKLDSQDPSAQIAGQFDGSFGVDFTCTDFYWLKAIVGDPSDAGGGPYTHEYTYDDTPKSFSIEHGLDLSTDSVRAYLGCVATSASISANVGDVIKGKVDGVYKTEAEDASLDGSPATTSEAPFTFAEASFEYPNATTINDIQSIDLTFNRNPELIRGLGSRFATGRYYGMRTVDMNLTLPITAAATFLEEAYGSGTAPNATVAEKATAELTLTNGGAGTALRKLAILVVNVFPQTYDTSLAPNERVDETITLTARGLTSAIYTNNTATAL